MTSRGRRRGSPPSRAALAAGRFHFPASRITTARLRRCCRRRWRGSGADSVRWAPLLPDTERGRDRPRSPRHSPRLPSSRVGAPASPLAGGRRARPAAGETKSPREKQQGLAIIPTASRSDSLSRFLSSPRTLAVAPNGAGGRRIGCETRTRFGGGGPGRRRRRPGRRRCAGRLAGRGGGSTRQAPAPLRARCAPYAVGCVARHRGRAPARIFESCVRVRVACACWSWCTRVTQRKR